MNKEDKIITADNIEELGFIYNYFDGYGYYHEKGFAVSVYDVNTIVYKEKKYICKTFADFYNLLNNI